MQKVNYYKLAPTWLYKEGKGKLFKTQEEVDDAWDEGWFGPPGKTPKAKEVESEPSESPEPSESKEVPSEAPEDPPVSTIEWGTKKDLRDLVKADPRYSGLKFYANMTTERMINVLVEYEVRKGIGEE